MKNSAFILFGIAVCVMSTQLASGIEITEEYLREFDLTKYSTVYKCNPSDEKTSEKTIAAVCKELRKQKTECPGQDFPKQADSMCDSFNGPIQDGDILINYCGKMTIGEAKLQKMIQFKPKDSSTLHCRTLGKLNNGSRYVRTQNDWQIKESQRKKNCYVVDDIELDTNSVKAKILKDENDLIGLESNYVAKRLRKALSEGNGKYSNYLIGVFNKNKNC